MGQEGKARLDTKLYGIKIIFQTHSICIIAQPLPIVI